MISRMNTSLGEESQAALLDFMVFNPKWILMESRYQLDLHIREAQLRCGLWMLKTSFGKAITSQDFSE